MASSHSRFQLGKRIARVLAGAWRASPPPLQLSPEELQSIVRLLLESGSAGLAWWRLRDTSLQTSPAAEELRQAYRLHALQAKLHETAIERVIAALDQAGVETILVKGWAVARLYPQPGLRPYGDLDLCFRPEQVAAAREVLERFASDNFVVDIHEGFSRIDHFDDARLFASARVESLGKVCVHLLRREDELRILCTHLLRHGVWRPLWLCDIAASLEALPADFDWSRFFGEDPVEADWLACTLVLAHRLLGAEISHTPVVSKAEHMPAWLVPQVLKNRQDFLARDRPMISYLRQPKALIPAMLKRWPDPIQTTTLYHLPLDETSRLPYQLREVVRRSIKLIKAFRKS
jgi:hypothetical protein